MKTFSLSNRRAIARASSIAAFVVGAFSIYGVAHADADADKTWQSVRKAGVLRCGAALSAPYVIRDPKTQTYSGPFPDLCKDFAEQVLKVKVEFVDTSWSNIIAGVQSNKWDMGMALTDTPERRKAIHFSTPVIYSSVTFDYNKSNPKLKGPLKSLPDLDQSDITLAVMSGSVADKAISDVLKKANIMRLPGSDEVRLALLSKRADVMVDDIGTNMLVAAVHVGTITMFEPQPPVMALPAGFGLNKNLTDADLRVLDDFITAKVKSGAIDRSTKVALEKTMEAGK